MDSQYTEATLQALRNLRDPSHFQWYVVPMFAFVMYVYFTEIERKRWDIVLAGLTLWGVDWLIEIVNALWLHFSGYSAIWTAPGQSAYQIMVGLNIEISMMFAIAGIAFTKLLPADRELKILGLPNRLFYILFNSTFCVAVEVVLNRWGALVWAYPWWNWPNIWLDIVFGYGLFMVSSFWVYDLPTMRSRIAVVGTLYFVDAIGLILFMGVLGWI